jgi:hypothetical protein
MIVRTVLALAVFCAVLGCSNKTKSVADIEQRELFDNSDRETFGGAAKNIFSGFFRRSGR